MYGPRPSHTPIGRQGAEEVMEEGYKKKLKLISQGFSELCDPYKVPIEMCSDDISLWPELEFGQLYIYLVSTTGEFTKEMLKNYKSLDAYNYYAR